MKMIRVDGLSRRFGRLEAVKEISLSVEEGEIFGFLGPNGAGKSTCINMLCTLLRPTSGHATVNGFDIVQQQSQVRRSIGLVFQDPTLDEYLTAEENLRFHAYAYGVAANVREERLYELLTMVELWERRKSRVSTFSGGMKRRLEIARGLLHHPRVLFLDEPTLGLDPQTRRRIWSYIHELRHKEMLTIFLTTHYMDEAENCDRIAIIDRGEVVALDTPERLKDAVGEDTISLRTEDNEGAALELQARYGVGVWFENGLLRFAIPHGEEFLPEFIRTASHPVLSCRIERPSLDDVFLKLTGQALRDEDVSPREQWRYRMRR